MTKGKSAKKKLFLNESRIWNYGLKRKNQLRSLMMGCFCDDNKVESYYT